MKSATWGGPKEKLSEAEALYRVVDQMWSWHLLDIDKKDRATQKRLVQRGIIQLHCVFAVGMGLGSCLTYSCAVSG